MRNGVRSALSVLLAGAAFSTVTTATVGRAEESEAARAPAESTPAAPSAEAPAPAAAATDDSKPVYVVKQGDTLSGLAKRCLGDGERWREIHHKNPQVKNPHWIYPGDELLLDCGQGASGETKVAAAAPAAAETEPAPTATPAEPAAAPEDSAGAAKPIGQAASNATAFRVTESQYAYIVSRRELPVAALAGNIDRINYFGQNQRVYLNAGKNSEFQVGDRFSIYRDSEIVAHPVTGSVLGYMTRILGDLVVEEVSDSSSIGRIIQAFETIQPGDLLAPYVDVSTAISPVDSDRALNGIIVGSPAIATDIVERRSVFLDKGKKDGVKAGNVVGIYRGSQVAADPITGHELDLPRELIGKAIVFRVEDATASAWVFSSSRNLLIGDQVSFE